MRQRYGVGVGGAVLAALVVANVGTTCAEFAGIAAGFEIFGDQSLLSVPGSRGDGVPAGPAGKFPPRRAAVADAVDGVPGLHRLGLSVAHPDWGAALHGTVVPSMPLTGEDDRDRHGNPGDHAGAVGPVVHAVLRGGQEVAGGGLSKLERIDVVTGAVLTGVIGFFRRRGLRGHPASGRPHHHRRRRRRRRTATLAGEAASRLVRRRP